MGQVATKKITVKKGDCLWTIMKNHGFPAKEWKRVYTANYNAAFKKKHPNPDMIPPGAIFYLPAYTPDQLTKMFKSFVSGQKKIFDMQKKISSLKKALVLIEKDLENNLQPTKQKIQALKAEAADLEWLSFQASGECSDVYSCIGGGLAGQKLYDESRALNRTAKKFELKLEDGVAANKKKMLMWKIALKALQTKRDALVKENTAVLKEISKGAAALY